MSKFLELLDKIRNGSPAPLGFGANRGQRVPAMALVGLISGDHASQINAVSDLALDALMLDGLQSPEEASRLPEALASASWGPRVTSLTEAEAQGYQDQKADLMVFSLDDTAAAAVSSDEAARILVLSPTVEEAELRAAASLPVDAFLLPMTRVSGAWGLRDLATVGAISRRVDKYILLEVPAPPTRAELEAIRDIGVHALVIDVNAAPTGSLSELKSALLDLPRQRPRNRDRASAILPGSVYSPARPGRHEEEEEDE